jgi:lipopolysaccharide biosynthesis protein
LRARVVALAVLLTALPALADEDTPEQVHMRFVERGDSLTVSTKIQKLFDEQAYAALSSGFPSTIVINTFVYPKDEKDPIAARQIQRSVVYDLWDEVYVIRMDATAKAIRVKYQSEALKLLTSVDDMPVARNVDLPYEDVFYLKMTVLLNPVDKKTLAEVQRWLSQSTGGGLDRGGVFFGNFVSVFVHPKIADADRVLYMRSQPFYRPKP